MSGKHDIRVGGEELELLSELARHTAAASSPATEAAPAWAGFRAARARDDRRRTARRVALGGVVVVAAALGGRALWPWGSGERLSYVLEGAPAGRGGRGEIDGYVAGNPASGATLKFSDGTRVALEGAARAFVASTDARGARVRLEEGRAHFSVVHRPRARWSVEAGPFVVAVTGTTFDVRWSSAEGRLDVHLIAGQVIVRGPLTGAGVTLSPGQELEARPAEGALRIDRAPETPQAPAPAPAVVAPAIVPAVASAPAPAVVTPAEAPRAPAARPVSPRAHGKPEAAAPATAPALGAGWGRDVARGDFAKVLREADEAGIDDCLRTLPSGPLAALGDAARYDGRAILAREALLAQRTRFPGSAAAEEAPFLLGRLAEGTGEGTRAALDWYQRYIEEAPSGTYAAEARGRAMLLLRALPSAERPRAAARDYLRLYPAGPYATQARQILDGER
jgi:hypothetical protein